MSDRNEAGFERAAAKAASTLCQAKSVTVVAHIDADGITAASIASAALSRSGVHHSVRFVKKVDDEEVRRVNDDPSDIVWLVDLGSGSFSKLDPMKVVVTDHHRADRSSRTRMDLFSFGSDHVNPHLYGLDGSKEISGAGSTYAVTRNMGSNNKDLASLAVVGAVGDLQDRDSGRLVGYNRKILQDAVEAGRVKPLIDLRLFGRETRPLHSYLAYANDPALLPVIRQTYQASFQRADEFENGDRELISSFLAGLGIEPRDGSGWRSWASLRPEERTVLASALCTCLLDAGHGVRAIRRLIGEAYVLDPRLVDAPDGWLAGPGVNCDGDGEAMPNARALLDAKEMATLLNACGRHGRPEIGMAICLGDRGEGLSETLQLQTRHRNALREAVALVQEGGEFGIKECEELPCLRYFHGGDRIEDTIVGIVAGMLIGDSVPADRPLLGLADATDGTATVKISARGTMGLVRRGLDLSTVMRKAAEAVGGAGGGHDVAAGASIPEGTEEEFLRIADGIVREQVSR